MLEIWKHIRLCDDFAEEVKRDARHFALTEQVDRSGKNSELSFESPQFESWIGDGYHGRDYSWFFPVFYGWIAASSSLA